MPFEHGKPKTGGRQTGTPNRAATELRQQLQAIVQTALADLPAVLATMDPAERIRLVAQLLPYVMPKLSNVDVNATIATEEPKGATIKVWTAEAVDEYDQWRVSQGLPSALA